MPYMTTPALYALSALPHLPLPLLLYATLNITHYVYVSGKRTNFISALNISNVCYYIHISLYPNILACQPYLIPPPPPLPRYWHRSLNPKKLIEIQFSHLQKNMTLQRTIKLYKLPDVPFIKFYHPLQYHSLSLLFSSYI